MLENLHQSLKVDRERRICVSKCRLVDVSSPSWLNLFSKAPNASVIECSIG